MYIKIATIFIIFIIVSCSKNINDIDKNPCPPIQVVPKAPYSNPVWHPGGKFIGFNYTFLDSITYPYGQNCIGVQHFNYDSSGFWLINPDGTNMRRIFPYHLQVVAWSPDGRWIAFVNDAQIYKMPFIVEEEKFDTTQIEQLTFEGKNFFPAWSPDGKWIAFDSNNNSPNGMYFIWKMRVDGTQKTRIAYEPSSGEIRMPNWSPDGKRIIHQKYILGVGAPEIFEIDNNGNDIKRLTFDQDMDSYPVYSYQNNMIAFLKQRTGYPQIWLMDETGSNLRQMTNSGVDAAFGLPFSWSPDGEKLVYTHYNSNNWSYNNGVLWILNISTGAEYQLTFNIAKK